MKKLPDTSKPSGPPNSHWTPPRVLITAGPTHEPIDAVRYLGNRSSGRMGIALAQAALKRNWPVTLLLGPVAINPATPPQGSHLTISRFQTAADLQRLLQELWPSHDLLLMAAAVADFSVDQASVADLATGKIKRRDQPLTLQLLPTPDLLASLEPMTRSDQTVIGFALESAADLESEAIRKLEAKHPHAIVANPLETMDSPDITATLLWRDGRISRPPSAMSKDRFADWLLNEIESSLHTKTTAR